MTQDLGNSLIRTSQNVFQGPSKVTLIPSGAAELLHYIVSKLTSLYSAESLTTTKVALKIKSIVKKFIQTEYIEIYVAEDNRLTSVERHHPVRTFEISNNSLVGFVAQNRVFQIINNPHTSTLYSTFAQKPLPYSREGNKLIIPSSMCAVPLCVPVTGALFGVVVLYNKEHGRNIKDCFSVNDVHLVSSVGLILTGHFSMFNQFKQNSEEEKRVKSASVDSTKPLEQRKNAKGHRYKALLQWCRQVSFVTNNTESKLILAKNILQKIYGEGTSETLIESSLHIVTSLLNADSTRLILRKNTEFTVFRAEESLTIECCPPADAELFEGVLLSARPFTYKSGHGKENVLVFPVPETDSLLIEVTNKKDETLAFLAEYSQEDYSVLGSIGTPLYAVLLDFLNDSPVNSPTLRSTLKYYLSTLNSLPIISTIRTASQQLLKSDRGTVFIRDHSNMVVQSQGKEQEIPVGFSVPLGKGIVGHVGQSGITENIPDAYSDPRFNPEVDKLTGYKTNNILCMPVFNSNSKVIAALQMINKSSGAFDKFDEETLNLFSEMVGSVLMKCELFQKTLEERTRFVNILNSIGTYVLVLNGQGKLDYSNRPIKGILGVTERTAKDRHYTTWLRQNKQLVLDITAVYQDPTEKISRSGQVLSCSASKHHFGGGATRLVRSFYYRVLALHEISGEASGAIIILEDSTVLEKLNCKYKAVKRQLKSLTSVETSTSLQKCLSKLEYIATVPAAAPFSSEIDYIVSVLKQGNLYQTEIRIPRELRSLGITVTSRMREDSQDLRQSEKGEFSRLNSSREEISDLDDWNLCLFSVTDHFAYVKGMLNRYSLIRQFEIPTKKLKNFMDSVKDNYAIYGNPYHNFVHGLTVMHSTFGLLTHCYSIFTPLELLALLLSSLCHDIGHTGRTNLFEINSRSSIAVVYNDTSVLENHHAALTFNVLSADCSNILESLPPDQYKDLRKLMIECIL